MKRWILGAVLFGIATGAYGADWIKVVSSPNGTMTLWAMRAQEAGELWEKEVYASPQAADGVLYNKTITLNEINCSQGSGLIIQATGYLDDKETITSSSGFTPYYAAPGTISSAVIDAYCGTK
jgi:hypothetical protein